MREAQEVEGLGFAQSTLLTLLPRKTTELDEPRLVRVQLQAKLGESLFEGSEELLGFLSVLEPEDGVVGIADDAYIALAVPLPPSVSPEIKGVVKR
ncbi:MAG: hypothetical protein QOF89_3174 [Acidobacteriota bacterium]|nr:hypothetical protein [Acidobacteriota bacterium]